LKIANAHFARGDLKTSRILLRAVVELEPANPLLVASLGSLHFQLGEFQQARRRFMEAIQLDDANPVLHAKLGAACLSLHDLPAFEAALERALVLDPNCAEALQLLANTNLQCGHAAQAAKLYQRLIALKPDDSSSLLALAKCLFVLGDKAGARAAFERVLGIEPANSIARENLALLDAPAAGPAAEAALDGSASASEAGQLTPDVAQWVAQADAAYARGELPTALAALQQAARHAPLCGPLWVALANVQTQLRLYPDALESCLAAEAMQPKAVDTLVRLAAAALRCDDIPRFESALGRALELEPNNTGALRLLADLNLQEKRYPDAARQYRQILQQTPHDSEVALSLGRCELQAGHLEAARLAFEQAIELEPGSESAREQLKAVEERIARQTANQRRDRPKVNWLEVTSKLAQLSQPAAPAV
jgi:tetratricopeptide (TPR) repeat protein